MMEIINTIAWCLRHGTRIVVLACLFSGPFGTQAIADETSDPKKRSIWESPIVLFQTTVSKADGQRCPMYPSCSHYADQATKRHGKILGWILTGDRLLRCGHDETRRSPQVVIQGIRRSYDPLEANTYWWSRP